MKLIPISQKSKSKEKFFAMVDDEDYEYLMQWKWHLLKKGNTQYAVSRGQYKDENRYFLMMHRVILNITDRNVHVDHIDHNGLNNQRSNIRTCTNSENLRNRKPKGEYLGVFEMSKRKYTKKKTGEVVFYERNAKYCAAIKVNGKSKFLGAYKSKKEAACAYDMAAKFYFKEFANLNFK